MKNWIIMFRPETYAAARAHGLMGVLNTHRRRFAEVRPGDRTGAGIDARELRWGLAVCDDNLKTEPTNVLLCKGGFMEIPESDYLWLRDVLSGEAPVSVPRALEGR